MKRAGILAIILFATAALAQVRGVPASVTSQTVTRSSPGVPASVTSLGPNGFAATPLPPMPPSTFTCFGGGLYCAPGTAPPAKGHHRHHRDSGYIPYGYPVYPAYSDYSGYPAVYTGDQLPVPGYMQPGYSGYGVPSAYPPDTDPPPAAPTVFERRPTSRPYARDEARYDQDYRPTDPAQPNEQRSKSVEIGVGEQDTTTLVFRDGHQMDLRNYAIVGRALFNFDGSGPFKVLLAELDIPATEKLNSDRGVIFKLPVDLNLPAK